MRIGKIVLECGILPKRATSGAACFDLYAPEDFYLTPGRQVMNLGMKLQLPTNMAAIIKSRSGFASRGMEVMVTDWSGQRTVHIDADVIQGVIDADYTGLVGVILNVHDDCRLKPFIPKGTRVAQMQLIDVPEVEFTQVDTLDETERGDGGFGHTGTKDIVEQSEKPKKKAGRPRKK